ncbi:MAG: hypothetical protein ACTHJQ_12920 [Rhizobiaceae bacterium]
MLRLSVYDLTPGPTPIPVRAGGIRFIFATSGELLITQSGRQTQLAADDGCFVDGPFEATGTGWLFECVPLDQPLLADVGMHIVLSHGIKPDFSGPYFLRADSVASDPGAETPLHGHRGPGIRRLREGRLLATIGDTVERLETGRAWFENGRDWVVGRNIHSGENIFIRVMLLPAELKGDISSFVPASPEEAKRPRLARYRIFGEQDLVPGARIR